MHLDKLSTETIKDIPVVKREVTEASSFGSQSEEVSLRDIETLKTIREKLLVELKKKIVGQDKVVDLLLTALFAGGHGLFIGVPGLAKTLLIQSLAEALSLNFNRVQFTPDLMPSDITGTDILDQDTSTGKRHFRFIKGPIFSNLLLADEINRTPPKTQAALLQAMQEKRVTATGSTYELEPPFLVFATQNPIEQEGTYSLPEAQLDRFMFSIHVDYPSMEEELEVVRRTTGLESEPIKPVLSKEELLHFQGMVKKIVAAPEIQKYAVEITRKTRPGDPEALDVVKDFVTWGAGPRASQYLVMAAKARAALHGRPHISHEDIRALAKAVLGHRMLLNFLAENEGLTTDIVIDRIIASIPHSTL